MAKKALVLKKHKTVLGIDPGKRSTHYVLLEAPRGKLLKTDKLDLFPDTDILTKTKGIRATAIKLLVDTQPNLVVVERYITRPRGGRGNTSEPVNIFIGILVSECQHLGIKLRLVTASQQKQWIKRTFNMTAQLKWRKPKFNEHQADAMAIGFYGLKHYLFKPPVIKPPIKRPKRRK